MWMVDQLWPDRAGAKSTIIQYGLRHGTLFGQLVVNVVVC